MRKALKRKTKKDQQIASAALSQVQTGKIPFKKAGTHRQIALNDFLAYKQQFKENRKEKMDFLTQQAQELHLGYE